MRFAIVSDIHGNLPALNAVIEDAENSHVDHYIFAGDYCSSNPYPDECITRIRNLDYKYTDNDLSLFLLGKRHMNCGKIHWMIV